MLCWISCGLGAEGGGGGDVIAADRTGPPKAESTERPLAIWAAADLRLHMLRRAVHPRGAYRLRLRPRALSTNAPLIIS